VITPATPLALLHPGDLTLRELFLILLAAAALPAVPVVLIGIFVRVVVRPKEKVSGIENTKADKGQG
jgi:hypothetical protein